MQFIQPAEFDKEMEPWLGTRWHGPAQDKLRLGIKIQPCRFCGSPAMCPSRECDGCWELTSRVDGFLRDGGLRAVTFLIRALAKVGRAHIIKHGD